MPNYDKLNYSLGRLELLLRYFVLGQVLKMNLKNTFIALEGFEPRFSCRKSPLPP